MVIWKHEGNLEDTSGRRVFSTFIECFQMTGEFYHSVINGLGFFICFKIKILQAQNNKPRFFYVLYTDKTWVFDQPERAQCPIYILNCNKHLYCRPCKDDFVLVYTSIEQPGRFEVRC